MAALMEEVIQADYDRANEWAFIECRHCSEYEGDFRDDLAADFAAHRLAHSEPRPVAGHSDDEAVDRFAASMKAKLAVARDKGRGGWDDPAQCSTDFLRQLLHEHVAKGDPVDVANFCMMLAHYGASTATHSPAPTEAGFRAMSDWDQRDEPVMLLVDYRGDGDHPLEDANFAITVGHNNDHNVGEAEGTGWHFAGWCWSHDHYNEGRGKPVGWMPLPHILARAYAAFEEASTQGGAEG